MGSRSKRAQWTNAAAFLGTAVLWYAVNRGNGGLGSIIAPMIFLAVALASSPLLKRTSVSQQQAVSAGSDVVIYHRPGCSFCIRLKAVLGTKGSKATWVDIWDDEDAAEFVRSVNEGNETVPTVVINGTPRTNPPPSMVRDALSN